MKSDYPVGVCAWCWQAGKDHCPSQLLIEAHTHGSWSDCMRCQHKKSHRSYTSWKQTAEKPISVRFKEFCFIKPSKCAKANHQMMAWSVCLRRLLDDLFHLPRKRNLYLERKHFTKFWCIWRSVIIRRGLPKLSKKNLQVNFRSPTRTCADGRTPSIRSLPYYHAPLKPHYFWAKCLGKKDLPEPRTGLKLGAKS